jgi:hypothetical protein
MSITLNWRDILTIVSLLIAIDSYRKLRREKAARKDARSELMRQVAAEAFENLAHEGYELESMLVGSEWASSKSHVDRLLLALGRANGAWSDLLSETERDKAEAAGLQVTNIQRALHPAPGGQDPSQPQQQEMQQQCATAYTLYSEVAGKLRYTDPGMGQTNTRLKRIIKWLKSSEGGQP